MNDEQKREMLNAAAADGIELSDVVLDNIAGGFVYHDKGDPVAHRREAFYVLDKNGDIIMKLDDVAKAKHWADNLRMSQRMLSADEFEKLRRSHSL